ncbi:MAG: hypothetical protein M3494_01160 [Actinomycetota bacterium]|nr:hypothetical protein [Actinomycetota bacterium]
MIARLPKVFGVGEARNSMTEMLDEVSRGRVFIIKGTKNREALVIDAETFRKFQESYMELVGIVETRKILEDDDAVGALRRVEEGGSSGVSLSEVERMVEKD